MYQLVLVYQGTWKTNQTEQGEHEEQAFGGAGNSHCCHRCSVSKKKMYIVKHEELNGKCTNSSWTSLISSGVISKKKKKKEHKINALHCITKEIIKIELNLKCHITMSFYTHTYFSTSPFAQLNAAVCLFPGFLVCRNSHTYLSLLL